MSDVTVRGGATPEELGAILALLRRGNDEPEMSGYEVWRRNRLRVLRADTAEPRVRTSR